MIQLEVNVKSNKSQFFAKRSREVLDSSKPEKADILKSQLFQQKTRTNK